jgi:hypothetical protein
VEVEELTPGVYAVTLGDASLQVLVPAGVGVPGVAEEDLVALLVSILVARGQGLPAVLDVSHLLGTDPTLFEEIARRAEE